jgi:hypothetical protein
MKYGSMPAPRRFPLLLALALAAALGACSPPEVTTYRVPKEADAPLAAAPVAPAGAPMAAAESPGAALTWTAPSTWQTKPAGAMRLASYAIPGPAGVTGDFSVSSFSGESGGELANLNRWRGQVQLPPIGEAEVAATVTRISAGGLSFTIADIGNPSGPNRILGAIVPFAGSTWFFKLTGPDYFVEEQKPAFLNFLETVRPAGAEGAATAESPAAAGGPAPAMADTPVPIAQGPGLAWTAPDRWKSKPAGPMRKATFEIDGPEGAGDLSITAFPHATGGELANVNRWRGQAGLPAVDAAGLEQAVSRTEQNGLRLTLVDAGGTGANRILAAMVPYGDGTWFFKLTGPDALVAREKPAFLAFLQTVRPAP